MLSAIDADFIIPEAEPNDHTPESLSQNADDRRCQVNSRIITVDDDDIRTMLLNALKYRIEILPGWNDIKGGLLGEQFQNALAKN
jgi:hypothetical protein